MYKISILLKEKHCAGHNLYFVNFKLNTYFYFIVKSTLNH